MTDNPDYRNSEMSADDALEYAMGELGSELNSNLDIENFGIHPKVKSFVKEHAYDRHSISLTEYKHGVMIDATWDGDVINPNKFVGRTPRFWFKPAHRLNIYFKKGELYYLLRFEI